VRQAEETLRRRLLAVPHLTVQADPVAALDGVGSRFAWRNVIATAPTFRRAHLEWLEVPGRLAVLHLCVFPHLDDATPVFGFDVVAGHARISGMFLDLSPTLAAPPRPGLSELVGAAALTGFAQPRGRPEWGDVFSDDFLAIRPQDADEAVRVVALADRAFAGLLAALSRPARGVADVAAVTAGQAHYAAAQRRNTHTLRVLSNLVGATAAACFVTESLFPDPRDQDRIALASQLS
jgi:phycocyanobilin:ferredoxin oxidoreductase